MALTRIKLGNLIELCEEKNSDNFYDVNSVKGISIQKKFIETKADMTGVSLKPYLIVKPDYFAYVTVTSRNSEKITLAHNTSNDTYIVSSSYVVFKVKRTDIILSDYLFIYFNRPEFDRFSRFNSWGSARETFDWETMCNIEIEVPSIEIQKKYVAIYNSMVANLCAYEKNLDDLKLVCEGYIEDLRKKNPISLKGHLIESTEKNDLLLAKSEKGVSIQKVLIDTKAKSSDITKQKLVRKGFFAFNSNTSRNSETISIALNRDEPCAVSNTYVVFSNDSHFIPEYLYLWFKRKEFDRYARFNSWGSARETLSLEEIENTIVGDATIEEQISIVNILNVLEKRQGFIVKLREQIKQVCPVLIRGAVLEGEK